MPAPIDDFVQDRLADPSFYPDKTDEERESIAWGIGWNQYKVKHPKWKSKAEKARAKNNRAKKKRAKKSDVAAVLLRVASTLDSRGFHGHADFLDSLAAHLSS